MDKEKKTNADSAKPNQTLPEQMYLCHFHLGPRSLICWV